MKKCELCGEGARMYCESDQASLCWDCDEKVHCANFLVAKHTRCLLCHACQSLTPWKASGPKLGHTVSVCDACVSLHSNNTQQHQQQQQQQVDNQSQEANSHDYDQDDDAESSESFKDGDEDEEDEEEEDYVDDEDDAENQVVPWSGNSTSSPPPPVLSSSSSMSSSEELFSRGVVLNKRIRNNPDLLYSDDEMGCSSSQVAGDDVTYFRPLKQKRTTEPNRSAGGQDHAETESTSTAAITSLKRLQKQIIADGEGASTVILGICNPSRDQSR
ncbi:zinc finger protein CONSTANS-LIKE 1-like [Carica papaya]|uniref:zinc finger protein CONSTANS-LIKE 1-like n=1 Tax=Carica papaya TaxID=3649 RepID=UPI000B8D08D8|nr:zinc finger protein CONSTANS-LIKE 1-like [Carica papaya]